MSELPVQSQPAPVTRDTIPMAQVVERYLQGATLTQLAAEYGAHWRTLYNWILAYNGDQHHEVVTHALTARVADADLALETASDNVQVTRASHRARFARLDLERRRPHLYGQAPTAAQTINIIVDRSCGTQPIDISAKAVNGSE